MASKGDFVAAKCISGRKERRFSLKCIKVAAKCISQKYQWRTLKPMQMNIEGPQQSQRSSSEPLKLTRTD